jgi:hypothetical protein
VQPAIIAANAVMVSLRIFRKPVVEIEASEAVEQPGTDVLPRGVQGEKIVLSRGKPLVIGNAVHSKTLGASFLADLQADYETYGKRIFAVMRERFPTKYFDALVSLAKVHRIELGPPGAFDRPQTTEEALDRLEQRAGPHARAMLEDFLKRIREHEEEMGSH